MFQPDGILLPALVLIRTIRVEIHKLFICAPDVPITGRFANQHADHTFGNRLNVHFCTSRVWMEIRLADHVSVTDDENRMDICFIVGNSFQQLREQVRIHALRFRGLTLPVRGRPEVGLRY